MKIYDTQTFIQHLLEKTDKEVKLDKISDKATTDKLTSESKEALCDELVDLLADTPYQKEYIDLLKIITNDKKLFNLLNFAFDKKAKKEIDINITTGTFAVPVKECVATQNEIDINKSLLFGLTNKWNSLNTYFTDDENGVHFYKQLPLLLYKLNNTYYIMDGHHRWSQTLMFNPDAKMSAIILTETKNGKVSPTDMLKQLQTVIALDKKERDEELEVATTSKKDEENLLSNACNINEIKKVIKKCWEGGVWSEGTDKEQKDVPYEEMQKLCCDMLSEKTGKKFKNENDVAKYLDENKRYVQEARMGELSKMPPRDVMPQSDTDKNPQEQVWRKRLSNARKKLD